MADESMAEMMGKRRAEEIHEHLKSADFSKCEVPAIPEALGYLVDGMAYLVDKKNGQGKTMIIFGKLFRIENFSPRDALQVLVILVLLVLILKPLIV